MAESPSQFTGALIAQLERCAKAFYDKSRAVFYETKTTYKNQPETFANVRSYDIDIYYNSHIVRFSYYPHVPLTMAHSVLTCYVSLEKADSKKLFYPLSQLYGYFKLSPAHALTIPMVTTADSMKECFDFLAASLHKMDSQIRNLSYDEARKTDLFNSEVEAAVALFKTEYPTNEDLRKFLDDAQRDWYPVWKAEQEKEYAATTETEMQADFERLLSRLMNNVQAFLEEDKQRLLSFYYRQLIIRALRAGYEAYMTGNYASAIKKLKKLKHRISYENGLIEYMENAATPRPHVPDAVFKNLTELYKNGIPQYSLKMALAVAPAVLLFGLMWLPLFLVIYGLFYFFESRDAVYLLGPLSNVPSAMVPAMMMGIPMIYFNSKRFYKVFFRKNYQRLIELENATHSYVSHQFMKFLTAILLIASIAFLFLTVHQNIKLTQNGFYDNTEFWGVYGSYYKYEEIDKLYYREQTHGEYGDMFPYPSYVIRLKNGKEIDPYLFDSWNEKFLDVFRSKGVLVEEPREM